MLGKITSDLALLAGPCKIMSTMYKGILTFETVPVGFSEKNKIAFYKSKSCAHIIKHQKGLCI